MNSRAPYRITGIVYCLAVICFLLPGAVSAQNNNSLDGINYQGKLLQLDGNQYSPSFPFSVRFSITDTSGTLYAETHSVNSLTKGVFNLVIGKGAVLGGNPYTQVRDIPLTDSTKIKVELDLGTGYTLFEYRELVSVPFASFSLFTKASLSVPALDDTGPAPALNSVFKWNGSLWIYSPDLASDTATFASNAQQAINADTAQFGYTSVNMNVDTAQYAYYIDTAGYAATTQNVPNADTANYAATVQFADSVLYAWNRYGNHTLAPFTLGTLDSVDLRFRTNNVQRFIFTSNGRFVYGSPLSDTASFIVKSNNGVLFSYSSPFTAWSLPPGGNVKSFFAAAKASWNTGMVTGTQWQDTAYIGLASMVFGYDSKSYGKSSLVFGDSSEAVPGNWPMNYTQDYTDAYCSFAFGKKAKAEGRMSVAIGNGTESNMFRGVAVGYQCKTDSNSANFAIGYKAVALGSTAAAFGYNVIASGHRSMVIGYHASSNGKEGTFLYGDESTTDTVKNTANNQFMIRAAGGVVFYSDTIGTGAALLPGSGSWSLVSDSLKKSGFRLLGPADLAPQFRHLEIYLWNYTSQQGVRHIGPTAQSFYRLFALGENDKSIGMVDADGLTLYMIKTEALRSENISSELDTKLSSLKTGMEQVEYGTLKTRVELLNSKLEEGHD